MLVTVLKYVTMKRFLIFLICGVFISNKLYAFCSEPMTPSPPSSWNKPSKPTVPFCVNEFSNTHNCDDWTIRSYNNDIENYRREIQNYQSELQDYVNDANRFASQAYDYANCEIRSLD